MFKSFKSVLMLLTCSTCLQSNSYNSYNSYRTRRRSPSYSASCGGMSLAGYAGLSQGKVSEESQNLPGRGSKDEISSEPLQQKDLQSTRKVFLHISKSQEKVERLHFRFWRLQNIQNDPKRWYTMRISIRVELPAVSKEHKRSSHE